MTGWISVENKMPKLRENVLVYIAKHKIVTVARLYMNNYWISDGLDEGTTQHVTHWMPLPCAPTCKNCTHFYTFPPYMLDGNTEGVCCMGAHKVVSPDDEACLDFFNEE